MDLSTERPAASAAETSLCSVQTELPAWRARRPQATFAEIEAAAEAQFGSLRAALIGQSLPAEARRAEAPAGRGSPAARVPAEGAPTIRNSMAPKPEFSRRRRRQTGRGRR